MFNGTAPPGFHMPPTYISGDSVITQYGFDDGLTIDLCAGLLFAITACLVVLAYAGLYRVVAERNRTLKVKPSKTVN